MKMEHQFLQMIAGWLNSLADDHFKDHDDHDEHVGDHPEHYGDHSLIVSDRHEIGNDHHQGDHHSCP